MIPARAEPNVEGGTTATGMELWDVAPCALGAFRDDGTIAAANSTLADMVEMAHEDLVGQSMEKILTVPARIFYQTHFFPLIKLHGRAEEIYLTLRARSGQAIPVLANAVRRWDGTDGQARNDFMFVRIQERAKYEEELLRARKAAEAASDAKTRFLSVISHDLRTPLGAIAGYADLLMMGVRGEVNDAQREDLERIKRSSRSLLGMLDDLLTFARSEGAQLPMRLESLPVDVALDEAESIVMPRFLQAGVAYSRAPSAHRLAVRADHARLQRILLNLLTNAVKFTPRGGEVSVSCSLVADRLLIRVTDTGRGIPGNMLTRVFEPFVQVDEADARNQKGMGLGLAISRELARVMGGDIAVESAVGRGSIFTVSLLPAAS